MVKSESDFKHRYRFSKGNNYGKKYKYLKKSMDSRGGSIPVELQVMAATRYWSRHEIQEDCAEIHGMSQQTLSRTAKRVAIALASKNLKICYIVCHWRGSTHDARIWRESSIKRRFEEREFKGKLIGDGGYPCTPYLLTPVLRPRNEAERRYNYSHIRTRNVIERLLHNLAIEFDDTLSYETPYTDSDEDTEAIE
ncbi:hypothetical protein SFRURICE_010403 [Spodoptera frugiperda]|nr:hypothetical protein SFRURICE_010403 [Spodoptera frugiperda]